jgi:hypothetical protein
LRQRSDVGLARLDHPAVVPFGIALAVREFHVLHRRGAGGKIRNGLYLNPPDNAVVFSVGEKSQVQALDRTTRILRITSHLMPTSGTRIVYVSMILSVATFAETPSWRSMVE